MQRTTTIIKHILPTNRFARRVSVLVGGTVGGQLVMVLAAPLLTRLYSPQDFGLLAVFVALLSLGTVLASLRYELAIPLPDDDREAAALLVLSLVTVVVVASISAIPLLVFQSTIAQILNMPRLADFLFLVPVGILFAGVYSVLTYWAVRMTAFAPLAKTKISQSLAAVGIQLAGAPLGAVSLLVGQVAGHGAGSLSLGLRVLRPRWALVGALRPSDIALVAMRYRLFPLLSTWSALFNTVGTHLPPVLFAIVFNPAIAGIYALSNRVLAMPMQILGQSIANVFFSDAAQAHRDGRLAPLVASVHGRLAHIAMPPALVLVFAGPDIFAKVFGSEWRDAGVFAQWLAPLIYLVFITSPVSLLYVVLEMQIAGIVFQGSLLAVRVAAIIAGAWIGDVMMAVALFAAGSTACWIGSLLWVIRVSGNKIGEIWRPTASAFGWAILLVSPIIAGSLWSMDRTLWFIPVAAAGLLIAARYAWLMKNAWK